MVFEVNEEAIDNHKELLALENKKIEEINSRIQQMENIIILHPELEILMYKTKHTISGLEDSIEWRRNFLLKVISRSRELNRYIDSLLDYKKSNITL